MHFDNLVNCASSFIFNISFVLKLNKPYLSMVCFVQQKPLHADVTSQRECWESL